MSTKKQKQLLFIPLINFIIPFCWLKMCFAYKTPLAWRMKKGVIMVAGILLISGLRVGLSLLIKNAFLNNIIYFIDVYLCFFIIAKISLDAQIELENKNND